MRKAAFSILFVTIVISTVGHPIAGSCQTPTPTSTETVTPTPTRTPIVGDVNGDGFVGSEDLLLVEKNWNKGVRPVSDGDVIEIPIPNLAACARHLRMVRIPAGTFEMGSPDTERGRNTDEGPVHTVTITQDFYLGETEVTQAQWKALMGSNPATDLGYPQYGVGNDDPVYNVSWNDITQANGFLSSLDSQSVYNGFRLPTEAEWEYACRAGASTRFSFGDNLSCNDFCGECALANPFMVWCGNQQGRSEPVGPPRSSNAFGLYDMHGNVWEWCQDWFQSDFYSQPGATAPNPLCNNSASGERVIRGGYWGDYARNCRSARRLRGLPSTRHYSIGVRVVLPAAP